MNPASAAPGPALFLAGDSFPGDVAVENDLVPWLSPHLAGWIGQADLLGGLPFERAIHRRAALLESALSTLPAPGRAILIGRSSGARVATEVACRRPVLAVICLGYPFRHPNKPPEPARFRHLAQIPVPTLILQGDRDAYGTSADALGHALSPCVTVRAVDARHDMMMRPAAWDAAARVILDFCAKAAAPLDLAG